MAAMRSKAACASAFIWADRFRKNDFAQTDDQPVRLAVHGDFPTLNFPAQADANSVCSLDRSHFHATSQRTIWCKQSAKACGALRVFDGLRRAERHGSLRRAALVSWKPQRLPSPGRRPEWPTPAFHSSLVDLRRGVEHDKDANSSVMKSA